MAEALARRGVDVEIAGLRPGRTEVTQVPFAPATAILPEGRKRGLHEAGAFRRLMTGKDTSAAARALIAERRADLVVVDCMLPAPLRGALDSGLPVIVLFHTFGPFWVRSFDRGPMGRMSAMSGLRPSALWDRARMKLLLTDRDLDPGREDPALSDYQWTGTTEIGAEPRAHGDRPRVLVALSSTDWPGMLAIYRRIVTALAGLPVDAVVTTGGVDLGGQLSGAENVEVRGWAPHADLLPTVDLVVGHGGHSTTMKVLAHGIPVLILPVNPTADQRLVGTTLQDAGVGRWLPKSASASKIRSVVEAMLGDDALRARAAASGARMRAARGGAEVAADAIVAVGSSD